MLDKTGTRQLAYVVTIDAIKPIEGSDNCECAVVGGWQVMVRKSQFKAGSLAIYFEIDSYLNPNNPAFSFMSSKKYKVKTQRYTFGGKGNFISQGLLMSAADFGWEVNLTTNSIIDDKGRIHSPNDESRFLTKELNITYYVKEDNKRKANFPDKYKKMAQRNGKLFAHQPFRWLMKKPWGRKTLFILFGRKKDKKNAWPSHICSKTDVERIQNMISILEDKTPYIATEKVDGTSCTIAAEKTLLGRVKYYICSRNVVFKDREQKTYYSSNVYFEAYEKYNLKEKITQILKDLKLKNIALQMEVYGDGIQKRDYSIDTHKIAVFHIMSNGQKFTMDKVIEICKKYELPHVPIIDENYIFPNTIEELKNWVEDSPSLIDGKKKEGIVFYNKNNAQLYTKFVSPKYLTKYH